MDTRKKIVEVKVDGSPQESVTQGTEDAQESTVTTKPAEIRILVDIHVSNGLHVRLFSYDSRSCSLYEKKFQRGYKFMQVEHDGDNPVFTINWNDVVVMLESPVVKVLKVK